VAYRIRWQTAAKVPAAPPVALAISQPTVEESV
jgi:hypothetical protein